MKNRVTLLAATVLFGSAALVAQTGSSDRMTGQGSPDQNFMMKAAQGGMAEVQMGKLAMEHGQNQAVKDFGQKMVDDHGKANDELKDLAGKKGVTLPSGLDAKDQSTLDRLSKMSGTGFDKAYMKDMVTDHRKDIAEFEREANSGKDPDVKDWASKTLPTLQEHLRMAEDTNGKLK